MSRYYKKIYEEKYYIDITKEKVKNRNINPREPKEVFVYKQYDLSNAKFDKKGLSSDEKRSVASLIKFLGWEIDIVHRVNIPDGVKTPDIYADGEYWDIKNYKKSLTSKSRFQKIWHSIDKGLNQANNFVVDLNNKDCNITNHEALKQINKAYRNFEKLNCVILLGKDNKNYYLKRK